MKIPKQAKKVFTGNIFDVYQWPQKMYDGSTATFEMVDRPDTVQVIAVKGNKIIIADEAQPNLKRGLTLFGGRIDKNEKPLAAAKRELLEESGLTSKNWKLLKKYSPLIKMDWEIFVYIAKNCRTVCQQKLDNGEKIKLVEMSFDKFIELLLSEKFWNTNLALYIANLKINGQLNQFKKQIFG